MLLPRRISEKKCRFTAKKITFFEYQRVKRLELTKNITERKRLGSILFLPEDSEVNSLTHESVQRILNQGSLFHSVNTKNVSTSNSSFDSLYNVNDTFRGSLHDILYGRIFNVRCLSNHDLCILMSYLIIASEFSEIDVSLLRKTLEHININFKTFSIAEISHILYSITEIININDIYKQFLDLCFSIVEKTTKLLFTKGRLNRINFVCSSNVCKIVYSLSNPVFLSISTSSGIELTELINVYEKYLEDAKANSRDFNLICKCMTQLSSPNFQLISRISDYYYNLLLNFNLNFKNVSIESSQSFNSAGRDGVNIGMDMLDYLDKMEENINLSGLIVLLDTIEQFGVNHKNLLNEFNTYILKYISILVNNQIMYNTNGSSDNVIRRKLFNLLKDDKYLKNDKLDLQRIYSELIKFNDNIGNSKRNNNNQHHYIWDENIIQKIYKYINNRGLLRRFIEVNMKNKSMGDNCNLIYKGNKLLDSRCVTEDDVVHKVVDDVKDVYHGEQQLREMEGLEKNQVIAKFIEAVEYLPKVINFNNVWKVLKAINLDKRIDLVPMFYSYLQEASIIFECLEDPSDDLLGIFSSVIKCKPCSDHLVELDNVCKMVEMFTDCDLKRDSVGIKMFMNMFNILCGVYRVREGEEYENMNQCGSLSYVEDLLRRYFREYSKRKSLEFERIPKGRSWHCRLKFVPRLGECRGAEDMMGVLEDLGNLRSELVEVVQLNRGVFRFVVYNTLVDKMDRLRLESG
ncbi:uncharacterized protein TOT_030000707 [Theileria orientalis strain Shintoku]|uniref:Uncharacterized protein n=1 Tax=Theileria orientalis strain Shintoku TaxID=869250 RepID=J4C425_THEOR|nr:uncharacterized protein TOT_030000707 [Theileria orientalis strain Shintoku]BAM41446.1 uncharacterized protein TOT_030000707 [Theileria orientalis strain Shintoku]|eukprot:XP_009691747.1 uncharacterized protein TOT_030000707 [Theileria orientalis strain Shintoku]